MSARSLIEQAVRNGAIGATLHFMTRKLGLPHDGSRALGESGSVSLEVRAGEAAYRANHCAG